MRHFADDNYDIEKAIARYEGLPFISKNKCECWEGYKRVPGTKPCAPGSCEKCDTHSKKSSDLNSQPFANPVPLADAPGTTPGNKPIDEVLENAPSAVGHGPDKTSSQGDKPSPHAAQAVFEALAGGNESEAKELLKQTDCPNGCEVHPEGKCNHGFMSAGRTRVRYLLNDNSFDKKDSDTESVK